jgi:hypothetical protein
MEKREFSMAARTKKLRWDENHRFSLSFYSMLGPTLQEFSDGKHCGGVAIFYSDAKS